jgi:antitoxin HicB
MAAFPYRILVEWSDEDECFIARVPAVETLATHGDTPEEATREAMVATKLMLEALAAHGRPIPASDTAADFAGKVALRIPRSMHARVARIAGAEDVSINQLLVSLISEGLGRRHGEEHKARTVKAPRTAPARKVAQRKTP